MAPTRPWNANIHYHPFVLGAIPKGAERVLDVGCGDGILAAQLAESGVPHVVGLDVDAGVLERAKTRHRDASIEWRHGDVFHVPFERNSFDAVVSVATLHHMDARAGLVRCADLVRPGGVLAVVGLAARDWWDWPAEALAPGARATLALSRGRWQHTAPIVWPPPATYREVKTLAAVLLPGVRYTRHLLGRYSLIWTKPSADCRE